MTTTNIFRKSPLRDVLIIALGIAALIGYFRLKPYWVVGEEPFNPRPHLKALSDSIMQARSIPRDSVEIHTALQDYSSLSLAISDSLNIPYTREYIHTHRLPVVVYEAFLNNYKGGNISIGLQPQVNLDANPSGYWAVVKISQYGDVVGMSHSLFGDTLANDTILARHLALRYAPPAWHNLQWKPDTTDDGYAFSAVLGDYPYHTEKASLSIKRFGFKKDNNGERKGISIQWNKDFIEKYEHTAGSEIAWLRSAVLIGMVISAISLVVVFLLRLRTKSVSMKVCFTISALATLYLSSTILSNDTSNILIIIFVLLFMGIFVGFLMMGMPGAAVMSLAQERFPERFYTLKRLRDKPWTSYFTGRSILVGIASGCGMTFISIGTIAIADHPLASFFSMKSYVLSYGITLAVSSPYMVILGMLAFTPLFGVTSSLLAPSLSYRYFPKYTRFIGGAILSSVIYLMLFSLQGTPHAGYILFSIVSGILYMYIFMLTDFLGVFTAVLVSSILFYLPAVTAHPLVAFIALPLIAIWFVLGCVAYIQQPEDVTENDYKPEFLKRLEDDARLREELVAAKVVQSRLLPARMPVYPHLDVAATCIPAFEVGGDYYDFFPLDESRLGVLIGDVSGKGMSAAFYITLAKGVIVSQVRNDFSPAEVLRRVNNLLYETMERGKFISMIYGVLNTDTLEFTYAQAGHNPIILRKADASAEALEAKGLALGLDRGGVFERAVRNYTLTLQPNDTMVFYTDGVVEAVNKHGQDYGDERFLSVVRSTNGSAAETLSTLLGDVKSFIGKAQQHDDITLVVMKF